MIQVYLNDKIIVVVVVVVVVHNLITRLSAEQAGVLQAWIATQGRIH